MNPGVSKCWMPVSVWEVFLSHGWRVFERLKIFRESFSESGEGVRLPRERGWPPGKSRNFRGSLGNFRGSLGNFRGASGLLLSSTVRELPGKSPKTSGEVRGTSGEVRGLPRSLGEPDSLPATRQICLHISLSRIILLVLPDYRNPGEERGGGAGQSMQGNSWARNWPGFAIPHSWYRAQKLTLRAQRLKKFNLDWKFQSRSKFSIAIEHFNPDLQNSPQKIGVCWVARLKFSISLENFNPGRRSWIFSIFGPLGPGLG